MVTGPTGRAHLTLLAVLLAGGCPTSAPAPPSCDLPPLDEELLPRLTFSLQPGLEVQPGEARMLFVGIVEDGAVLRPLEACVEWAVSAPELADIDPDGRLSISPDTAAGRTFEVAATLEGDRHVVRDTVMVWTPESHPLVGHWVETHLIDCDSGEARVPNAPIGSVRFRAEGSFSVTWAPGSPYLDYWGLYLFGLVGTELEWIDGTLPEDFAGTGSFERGEDELRLDGIWLGRPDGQDERGCGHVLVPAASLTPPS